MKLTAIALGLIATHALTTSPARAASCGYGLPTWDVEHGALVLRKAPGAIGSILSAVGQYATHSALSTSGWVTHATFDSSTVGEGTCGTPLDGKSLQNGMPGAEQIDIAAFYASTYGGSEPSTDVWYQRGNNPDGDWAYDIDNPGNPWTWWPGNSNRGGRIADFLWSTLPYTWQSTSDGDGYYRIYDQASGPLYYGFYQYKDIETRGRQGGTAKNNGVVCSTLLAWAGYQSGAGWVSPDNADVHNPALNSAMRALYESIKGECNSKVNWVQKTGCFFTNGTKGICERMADQVVNCFATGSCANSSQDPWHAIANDPNAFSHSVSPDCLASRGNICNTVGGGSSPWAYDLSAQRHINWSGGGAVYSCWD